MRRDSHSTAASAQPAVSPAQCGFVRYPAQAAQRTLSSDKPRRKYILNLQTRHLFICLYTTARTCPGHWNRRLQLPSVPKPPTNGGDWRIFHCNLELPQVVLHNTFLCKIPIRSQNNNTRFKVHLQQISRFHKMFFFSIKHNSALHLQKPATTLPLCRFEFCM